MPCLHLPICILAIASAACGQPCQPRWSPLADGSCGGVDIFDFLCFVNQYNAGC